MAFTLPKAEFQISARDNTSKTFRRVRANLSDLSGAAQRSIRVIGGVTAGATAAGGAIAYFADRALNTTQQLSNLSKQTGFTTGRIQELRYAAETLGVQSETMDDALAELSQRMGEAAKDGGEMAKGFKQAGIEIDGLLNRQPNKVFNDLAGSIANANSEAEAAAIATKALGEEAGRQLLPVLREGASRINKLAQEARDMNLVMSQETVQGANQAAQELDKLKQVISLQFTRAISELGPDITRFTSALADNPQVIRSFAESVGALAANIGTAAENARLLYGFVSQEPPSELAEGPDADKQKKLLELIGKRNEELERFKSLAESLEGEDVRLPERTEEQARGTRQEIQILNEKIRGLKSELGLVGESAEGAAKGLDKAGSAAETAGAKAEGAASKQAAFAGEVKKAEGPLKQSFDTTTKYRKELEQLLDAAIPAREAQERLANDTNLAEQAFARGDMSIQQYNAVVEHAAGVQRETAEAANQAADSTERLGQQQSQTAQIYEDTASSIRSAFSDTFRDMMDEGVGSARQMADRMVAIFKDLAAQLATMKIAGPVIRPMTQGMGAAMGVPASGQSQVLKQLGMSGGGGSGVSSAINAWGASNLGTAYGGVAGAQGSQLASQTAGFGAFGQQATSGAAGYGSASASGASLTGIAGAGGLGALGGYTLSGMIGPGGSQNRTAAAGLGGAGAAAGMMVGGPVGAAVGGLAGGALGSGMFAGDWETDDQGVVARYSGGRFSGKTYRDQSRDGGWFSSDDSRRQTDPLDADIAGAINRTFDNLEDQIRDMADTLGKDAAGAIRQFTTEAELSLEGLSDDEITRRLEEWVHGVANSMADSVVGSIDRFERAGESAKETFDRLVSTVETWGQTTEKVDDAIDRISLSELHTRITSEMTSINSLTLGELRSNIRGDVKAVNGYTLAELRSQFGVDVANINQLSIAELKQAIGQDIQQINGMDLAKIEQQAATDMATINSLTLGELRSNIRGDVKAVNGYTLAELRSQFGVDVANINQLSIAELERAIGQDIQQINGMDLTTLTQATSDAVAKIGQQASTTSQLMTELAGTTDVQRRVELEQQITESVISRYRTEQEMLDSLRGAVGRIQGDLSGLGEDVQEKIEQAKIPESPIDTPQHRDPDVIANSINSALGNVGSIPGLDAINQAKQIRDAARAWSGVDAAMQKLASEKSDVDDVANHRWWADRGYAGSHHNESYLDMDRTNRQRATAFLPADRWEPTRMRMDALYTKNDFGNYIHDDDPLTRKSPENVDLSNKSGIDWVKRWSGSGNPREIEEAVSGIGSPVHGKSAFSGISDYMSAFENARRVVRNAQNTGSYPGISVEESQKQVTDAWANFQNQMKDWIADADDATAKLKDLRDETNRYYEAQKKLADFMTSAAQTMGQTIEDLKRSNISPSERISNRREAFFSLREEARGMEGTRLAAAGKELSNMAKPLLQEAEQVYASGERYQSLFDRVTGALETVKGQIDEGTPDNYQQTQRDLLKSLNNQIDKLEGQAQTADQILVDAIEQSKNATVDQLKDIKELLGSSDLTDGSHAAGLPRVPRDGYRAELHAGEAVIDAGTMSALRRYGIPAQAPGGGGITEGQVRTIVREVVSQTGEGSGEMRVQIVTPDGRVQREETIRDLYKRSKRGEVVIAADGVEAEA